MSALCGAPLRIQFVCEKIVGLGQNAALSPIFISPNMIFIEPTLNQKEGETTTESQSQF